MKLYVAVSLGKLLGASHCSQGPSFLHPVNQVSLLSWLLQRRRGLFTYQVIHTKSTVKNNHSINHIQSNLHLQCLFGETKLFIVVMINLRGRSHTMSFKNYRFFPFPLVIFSHHIQSMISRHWKHLHSQGQ